MLQIDKLIRKYFLFLIVIFLPGCSVTVTCPSGYKISYAICVEDPGEKSVNALNTKKSGENNIESLRDQNIAKIINSAKRENDINQSNALTKDINNQRQNIISSDKTNASKISEIESKNIPNSNKDRNANSLNANDDFSFLIQCKSIDLDRCMQISINKFEAENLSNQKKYIEIFKIGCMQNNILACDKLGEIYNLGVVIREDSKIASDYYKKSCDLGFFKSCNKYLSIYFYKLPTLGDAVLHGYASEACHRNSAEACMILGDLYENGIGIVANKKLAIEKYEKSCRLEHAPACRLAGSLLLKLDSKSIINDGIITLYKKGCTLNDSNSCLDLGRIYSDSSMNNRDNKVALNYITRSCDLKNEQACQLKNSHKTINEEDAMCPKKYELNSGESILLTSNISITAINYCYDMTALERSQYINKNQKNAADTWYKQIKSTVIKINPKIKTAEIYQCSKYRFKDQERLLSLHFLGTMMPIFGAQSKQYNHQIADYCKVFLTQLQIQKMELVGR
jgi:uncharacterized protein